MICKKCGANMPDGSNVCSVCGASMTASPFMQAADLDGFERGSVSAPERKREDEQRSQPEVRFNMGGSPKSATVETSAPKQYCTNCGVPMEAGSRFCIGCGASVDGVKANTGSEIENCVNEVTTKVRDTVKGKSKKQLCIIGGVVAALVLVVGIILFALLGGRSAKATVKKYIDATYSVNVKTIIKLIPKDIIEYAMEEEGYDLDEYDEFCEEMEDTLKDMLDSYEDYFGDDWEYSYKIEDIDDVSNKKLRDIQEEYEDEFDIKVKDAKTVEVEITIEGEDAEESVTQKLALIKVGNSWYLDIVSMGSLF